MCSANEGGSMQITIQHLFRARCAGLQMGVVYQFFKKFAIVVHFCFFFKFVMVNHKTLKRHKPSIASNEVGDLKKIKRNSNENAYVKLNSDNACEERVSKCSLCESIFNDESVAFACRSCVASNSDSAGEITDDLKKFSKYCF